MVVSDYIPLPDELAIEITKDLFGKPNKPLVISMVIQSGARLVNGNWASCLT